MSQPRRPRDRSEFEIAIICALQIEADTVLALFDGFWDGDQGSYGKSRGDPNAYTTGWIGGHNVVLAHMPGMGTEAAAAVATAFRISFSGIKLGLVVGICGGVPGGAGSDEEIVLGDVVISTSVINYTFGRQLPEKTSRKDALEDSLGRANSQIRAFIQQLRTARYRQLITKETAENIIHLQKESGLGDLNYPGAALDILYESGYRHKHQVSRSCPTCAKCVTLDGEVCSKAIELSCGDVGCSLDRTIKRERLGEMAESDPSVSGSGTESAGNPRIHFGRIASGNMVMRSGQHRDAIAANEGVIAFEMEGAGVWDSLPTIVVKGICDYSDSHKNKRWQRYAAASAAASMKAVLRHWAAEDPKPLQTPGLNTVPKFHVSKFFGRHKLIETIEDIIAAGSQDKTRPNILVFKAIGGQGKSQLALQICERLKRTFEGLFWVDATSASTAERAYELLAKDLNTHYRQLDSAAACVKAVADSLESWDKPWLLVLDNYDHPQDFGNLQDYMPMSNRGTIIITSRHEGASRLGKVITIPSMADDGGEDLLLHEYWDKDTDSEQVQEAEKILERLGGLALAIDQAAAYINYHKVKLSIFLVEYEVQKEKVLKHTSEIWPYHKDNPEPISAFTTWEMTLDKLTSEYTGYKSHVAAFLSVCAFLNPDHIGEDIFRIHQQHRGDCFPWYQLFTVEHEDESDNEDEDLLERGPDDIKRRHWKGDLFLQVISHLYRIGLLQTVSASTEDSPTFFSLHMVIKDWLQIRRTSRVRNKTLQECIEMMADVSRALSRKDSSAAMRNGILPHLDACIEASHRVKLTYGSGGQRMRNEIIEFATFYAREGYYDACAKLLEDVVEADAKYLPLENLERLRSMSSLGNTYQYQGRWDKAESIHKRVTEVMKRALGDEHSDTIASISSLAAAYSEQGKFEEAETLELYVKETAERALGKDHVDTYAYTANLASTYDRLGRMEEAETLKVQVIEGFKRIHGIEHILTLTAMSNLANIYLVQGRLQEAEIIQRKVIDTTKRTLGNKHPRTSSMMAVQAGNYLFQGRLKEAEELQVQVLEIRERTIGKEHPLALMSKAHLAETYHGQQRLTEAEDLALQATDKMKLTVGIEHPKTLDCKSILASIYRDQERLEEAEKLQVEVVETRKRLFGHENPKTRQDIHRLVKIHSLQGRFKEGEQLRLQLGQENSNRKDLDSGLTTEQDLSPTPNPRRSGESQGLELEGLEISPTPLKRGRNNTMSETEGSKNEKSREKKRQDRRRTREEVRPERSMVLRSAGKSSRDLA